MDESTSARDSRWIWFLVGRVVCYTFLGGLSMAMVGALIIAAVGTLTNWILVDPSAVSFNFIEFGGFILLRLAQLGLSWVGIDTESIGFATGFLIGLVLGGVFGGMTGGFTFAVHCFSSPPGRGWLPPHPLFARVALGMLLGACAITMSSYALFGILSQGDLGHFRGLIGQFIVFLMYGIPLVMMGGGVAGAMWGFRREARSVKRADL